jgi:hypothetical protein
VHSRRVRRTSRRGRVSRGPFRPILLIVAGSCVAVLAIAYAATAGPGERAVDAGSIGTAGWGRGGYTMMPGPGAAAPDWAAPGGSGSGGSGSDGSGSGWSGSGGSGSGGSAASSAQAPGFAANAAAVTSQNWAGYAAAGDPGTFTSVSASWTEPAVTCTATNTFASFWAGLDGDGTNTVEQTGTEADCDGGAAAYQGWFEMFPNAPVFYDNPVQPGDAMSASVVADGGTFTLTLTDTTQGWNQTTNQTSAAAQLGSAEVIAEAPSSGAGSVLPLSNFGTVSFTGVSADNTALGNENPSGLTMVSANGVTEATPSALTGGNAFTVTWDSSGTAAAPAPGPSATAPGTGVPLPGTGIPPGRHHHHHWFAG